MILSKKKYEIIKWVLILFGVLLRVLYLNRFPAGLNCDEASSTYEAFSILTTLHDRNNYILPVYLLAWGSGQNALLTYIMVPFVKFLGMNILATRLPMAIISSLSIIIFAKILEMAINDKKLVIFAILFFVLNPWHIMKSRWGLESNLLPDFMLLAVFFMILFLYNRKDRFLYIGFVFLSISAYAYSTSYVALSIFAILFFIYCFKNKSIKLRSTFVCLIIVAVITWPLIYFVLINFFGLEELRLPFLSIPKLRVNRMMLESNGGDIFLSVVNSFFNTIKLLIIQIDDAYWNSINGIGIYYLFGFPILVVGLVSYVSGKVKKENNDRVDDVFMIWLISGFILCLFIKTVNINRCNFVIIPIIYFIIKGFIFLFCIKGFAGKLIYIGSILILVISFLTFSYKYIDLNIKKEQNILIYKQNADKRDCFGVGLEPLINYLDKQDFKKINIGSFVAEPYIFVLYYTSMNPDEFINNCTLYNKDGTFDNVKSVGKWNFDNVGLISKDKNLVYVLDNSYRKYFTEDQFDIKDIDHYIVVRLKNG